MADSLARRLRRRLAGPQPPDPADAVGMKLVVGLGNPGKEYVETRHNVGFAVVELLAEWNHAGGWASKFDGLVADCHVGAQKVLLVKPTTFMNRSGSCVRKVCDFYKTPPEDVLVVCDDLDLPLGRLRLKGKGSSGGQNGLKDIVRHLATEEVARLRVGIGERGRMDAADFVLSRFRPGETDVVRPALVDAGRCCEKWASDSLAAAMNEFNGKP